MSGWIILDDANNPAVEGGTYVISYGELVDGYRHAWHDGERVRYGRNFGHPADPRCPECNPPAVASDTTEGAR